MTKKFLIISFLLPAFIQCVFAANHKALDQPDSLYLFSYGTNGLRFAWSIDKQNWTAIGNGYPFLRSDYGTWGAEKKMYTPYLIRGANDTWHIVWSVNDRALQFAHASSADLINWRPQNYPYVQKGRNVLRPVISYSKSTGKYTIVYADSGNEYFRTETKDFKSYTPVEKITASAYTNLGTTVSLQGEKVEGQVHRVAWALVEGLIKAYDLQQYKAIQNAETTKDDAIRFAGLKTVDAEIMLHPGEAKKISTMLTGVFFEDINYGADGGLYAELIQNRDFEYHPRDKKYSDKEWNSSSCWSLKGENATFRIDSVKPVHPNNLHYAVLTVEKPGASLVNTGYDGIAVKKGDPYIFSAFTGLLQGKGNKLAIKLVSDSRGVLAGNTITVSASGWKSLKSTLIPSADASDARLEIQPLSSGGIALDMVSLFPQKTFKGRKNGLRADLAQTIADIHPRFVRFPGGCVAHGDGIANIYKWKNSIGPLESRKGDRNIWNYHQSMGLGYFEYFQFCEDIGAEAVPIIAAGVPCQNSSTGGGGQQGGIPMDEMGAYIQDIIDLVEYANGAPNTVWGRKRAEAGHPRPFNLKYIGIGNEDMITDVFRERFEMIYKALKKAHPEITVIGTAGPFFEGSDYVEGWKIASELNIPVMDEHYYQSPGWFINNQDFYDRYDRSKSKVYLGEYAASLPGGNKTNLETALAEALYLTSLERNGDVVEMASYAPLLARENHTQWNPDLIYFNNTEVKPTTGYYVQQLYGQNAGDQYIPSSVSLSNTNTPVKKRIACSVVKDSKTNEIVVKLVNILPVPVNTSLDLQTYRPESGKAGKTVISGNPADRDVRPVTSQTDIAGKTTLELAPYSFTVLRFRVKN